jgi:hypothetical protein
MAAMGNHAVSRNLGALPTEAGVLTGVHWELSVQQIQLTVTIYLCL